MFAAEAARLECLLAAYPAEALSPLLNIGSSTRHFRETVQPWTDALLFAPLRVRGIGLIHLDTKEGEGIDIRANVLNDADLPRIMAHTPKAVLCCNILEHVEDPHALARRCIDIVGPGGFVFITVPYSYPHHRDPIDTMFRPTPEALATLFLGAVPLHGEIFDVGESYLDQVKKRPWLLLRHALRFPFPFLGWQRWKRSMAKTYWLAHNYKVTIGVFHIPPASKAA